MNSEQLAASATITAANIQADITMQAAYFNFAAIVIGIFLSWMTALHIQKVARLAETRRNVYLELMESFSEMHTAFYSFTNKDDSEETLINKINKFSIIADKASFVAKTSTKRDIYNFLNSFRENSEKLGPFIVDYIEAKDNFNKHISLHSSEIDELNSRIDYLEEIRLNNPDDKRISELMGIIDGKIKVAETKLTAVNEAYEELGLQKAIVKQQIIIFLDSINDLALPISHKLRDELGAKTDIKLDYSIHKSQKK
ncbi:hypothetical protein [Acinetobacter courvalinii]|uniref:hypothetical protein n=1 Tax=Acinetobacter courvalinii TaxID=280147 RepID=UPI00289689E5|nr:hypothetical protein [Acinetobacter courvalinii]